MRIQKKIRYYSILSILLLNVLPTLVLSKSDFMKSSWLEKFTGETIVIENMYGNVRLRYGGENNALEYIAVSQNLDDNSQLSIKVDKNEKDIIKFMVINKSFPNQKIEQKSRLDITFFIPKNKNIHITTKNGLIEAKGLIANIEATSINGNISLNKNNGSLKTTNSSGKTDVTITKLSMNMTQKFTSTTGEVNIWISRKSNYLVEVSTSSDIISDFSMKIKNSYNQEPNKKGIIKLNKRKSKIIIISKRGRTAIRGFGQH